MALSLALAEVDGRVDMDVDDAAHDEVIGAELQDVEQLALVGDGRAVDARRPNHRRARFDKARIPELTLAWWQGIGALDDRVDQALGRHIDDEFARGADVPFRVFLD